MGVFTMMKRNEVNVEHTWDLSALFENEVVYEAAKQQLVQDVDTFIKHHSDVIDSVEKLNMALDDYQDLNILRTHIGTYASLHLNADQSDELNVKRMGEVQILFSQLNHQLSFFDAGLLEVSDELLTQAALVSEANAPYLNDILRNKEQYLGKAQEGLLALLGSTLDAPYGTYNRTKLADMAFPDFEVNGVTYPMSFVYYENVLEFHEDREVRHKAFEVFHDTLRHYQHTVASVYQTQVLKEKAIADARGYDSVIDYLLHSQKVTRDMYDRQIDLVMEHLAPHIRKFAGLLQKIHGLDEMTFQDLKLSVDFDYEPTITIEESQQYLLDGLSVLGDEYTDMIKQSFDDRWIDFPQNVGKSTGAFCSSPYANHPYILINWTQRMREVFVLAHEVGHAGHFYLSGKAQSLYGTRASTYFIEAPSTMNELLMADHLMKQKEEPRFKRWVLSSMISRTYYHNFVTHLLEAAFQREVYRLVDARKPLSTQILNQLKRDVLERFWGESVSITPGAELTWMRQPHYYMGLYPYTYSAGLTISTLVSQKIINKELDISVWLDILKTGGTKTPLELAQMANVDMSNDDAILTTIDSIGDMIQNIIDLS